jgi:hypothetical protein
MKQISIDALNAHLFETIEMLKNNRNKNASAIEKIDIETARAISDLAKNVIEGYKVKVQVLNIYSKANNPKLLQEKISENGLLELNP